MNRRYHFYKGNFESQFQTKDRDQITPYLSFAQIEPLPRFVLINPIEIQESEFNRINDFFNEPHIHISKPGDLEIRFTENAAVISSFEQIIIFSDSEACKSLEEIQEHEISAEGLPTIFQFIARKDNIDHGRLVGYAWCKLVEHIEEVKVEKLIPLPHSNERPVSIHTKMEPNQTGSAVVDPPAPESANNGCLGSIFPFGSSAGSGYNGSFLGSNNGCLNSVIPVGGTGCAPSGCGLLSLLLGIGLSFSLFRACTTTPPIPPPVVIHDTIYVEKIKQRIDTIRLVSIDTIRMVDSTRQINYETLTLPNVNFFTKSDKLTPSSVPDIQQVAEYLNNHPDLEAVVIGHTDNLGVPAENMELSSRRAEAVRNLIIIMGVDAKRISAIGKGDSEPKADNKTEEGRLMNRRVELQLRSNETIETKRTILPEHNE